MRKLVCCSCIDFYTLSSLIILNSLTRTCLDYLNIGIYGPQNAYRRDDAARLFISHVPFFILEEPSFEQCYPISPDRVTWVNEQHASNNLVRPRFHCCVSETVTNTCEEIRLNNAFKTEK